jgi:hypothetical protein
MYATVYFLLGNTFQIKNKCLSATKKRRYSIENLKQCACTQRKSDVLVGIEQEAYTLEAPNQKRNTITEPT